MQYFKDRLLFTGVAKTDMEMYRFRQSITNHHRYHWSCPSLARHKGQFEERHHLLFRAFSLALVSGFGLRMILLRQTSTSARRHLAQLVSPARDSCP